MLRFLLIFLGWVVLLFALELLRPVQEHAVQPFTAALATTSASLMQPFDSSVASSGKVLYDVQSGFAVAIEAGCNGVEAMLILIAAMLAWPATTKQRLAGIGVGTLSVQLLNLVRIITLYYLGQWNPTLFEWAHLYLWQALIMLDVLVVWLVWLHWMGRDKTMPDAPLAA